MIPYNEEHIEAEEAKFANHRHELISKLNPEYQAKYQKLEELIGEIDKLELPFWMGVLAPTSHSTDPTHYSAVAFHNLHTYGTRGDFHISEFFIKELLTSVVLSFSKKFIEEEKGNSFKAFWRVLEEVHGHMTGNRSPMEQKYAEKAYDHFNKEMSLDLTL